MKKGLIAFVVMICLMCPLLASCGGNSNNEVSVLKIDYMKDLSINIDKSKALGIKKGVADNGATAESLSCSRVDLLSADLLAEKEVSERNYIYSTTEDYENGDVEYDESSITKVTFKKNTSVTEDVYDSNGMLIEVGNEIKQEDVPAQINKLYVSSKFGFMQFVALVDKSGKYDYKENGKVKNEFVELRPDALVYDENGISDFDLQNYYSSALSQSFVVDTESGNIYKISNFNIAKICDVDIVKDANGDYYKMKINADNELVFINIMPNKNVTVVNFATDKYGYTFVCNSGVDSIDKENKIVYFSDVSCWISADKKVYYVELVNSWDAVTKVFENGEWKDFGANEIIAKLKPINPETYVLILVGYWNENKVCNGKGMQKVNEVYRNELLQNSIYVEPNETHAEVRWLDDDFSTGILVITTNNDTYFKAVDVASCIGTNTVYTKADFTKGLDSANVVKYDKDYYMNVGKNKIKIKNVYKSVSTTGTNYYRAVKNGDKVDLVLLENVEYSQNTFMFQPINK